jgi:hypothetical protein
VPGGTTSIISYQRITLLLWEVDLAASVSGDFSVGVSLTKAKRNLVLQVTLWYLASKCFFSRLTR